MARRAAITALVLGLGLAGCAGSEPASSEPVATTTVDLPRSYKFAPERIRVDAGDEVTWTNNDQFTHNIVLLEPEEVEVGNMSPGESVTHAFDEQGVYRYQCTFHPRDMNGEVLVE